jgi:hypothetical protein
VNGVALNYRGIEYALRQGIEREQWVCVIYYPGTEGVETRFSGTRAAAIEATRLRISNWLERQQKQMG